jgi:glycosyltransferase involved in cell wall biosynthesis
MPKLSFQLTARNNAPFVAEAIRSLAAEPFRDREILVLDDASEDKTFEEMQRALEDVPGAKLFRNESRLGVAKARQRLAEASDCEYIAPFDGDDILLPGALQEKLDFLDANRAFAGAYGKHCAVDSSGGIPQGVYGYPFSRMELAFSSIVGTCGMVVRKTDFDTAGGFLETGAGADSINEDQYLWLRLACFKELKFINKAAFLYRMHPGQVTKRKHELKEKAMENIYAAILESQQEALDALRAGRVDKSRKQAALVVLAILARLSSKAPEDFARTVAASYALDPGDYGTVLRLQSIRFHRKDYGGALACCDALLKNFASEASLVAKALRLKIATLVAAGTPFDAEKLSAELREADAAYQTLA